MIIVYEKIKKARILSIHSHSSCTEFYYHCSYYTRLHARRQVKIKQVFSTFFVELHKKQDVKSMFLMKKYVVSTQLFVEFSRNLRFLFPQPAYNSPIPWEN